MRIAVIGATGLVGSHLLPLLGGHDLLVLTRRPTGRGGFREIVAPAEDWPGLLREEQVDVAISTLGTTWKKAGDWATFEKVDLTAVVEFARAAKASGCRHLISVSSVGADPRSANHYLALKGRAEAELASLNLRRLDVIRPGLLRGERGSDRRFGERLGIAVSPVTNLFLRGSWERFAAIDAEQVARAIAALLQCSEAGVFVHHNRAIRKLASGL